MNITSNLLEEYAPISLVICSIVVGIGDEKVIVILEGFYTIEYGLMPTATQWEGQPRYNQKDVLFNHVILMSLTLHSSLFRSTFVLVRKRFDIWPYRKKGVCQSQCSGKAGHPLLYMNISCQEIQLRRQWNRSCLIMDYKPILLEK